MLVLVLTLVLTLVLVLVQAQGRERESDRRGSNQVLLRPAVQLQYRRAVARQQSLRAGSPPSPLPVIAQADLP